MAEGQRINAEEQLDLQLKALLRILVENQRSDFTQNRVVPLPDSTSDELLASYRKSPQFQPLSRLISRVLANKKIKCFDFLKSYAAGKIFQEMAWGVLSGKCGDDEVVLSSAQTFKLYQALYPRNHVTVSPFNLDSLENISVPDSLVVDSETGEIKGVVESTAHRYCKFRVKRDSYRKDSRRFPVVFSPSASVLFVVPNYSGLIDECQRLNMNYFVMPCSSKDIDSFIDETISSNT